MAREDEEWARAARQGSRRARRVWFRGAMVGALALVALAGVARWLYWVEIESKKQPGAECGSMAECAAGAICFDFRCTEMCDDGSCRAGGSCVEVPTEVLPVGGGSGRPRRVPAPVRSGRTGAARPARA